MGKIKMILEKLEMSNEFDFFYRTFGILCVGDFYYDYPFPLDYNKKDILKLYDFLGMIIEKYELRK